MASESFPNALSFLLGSTLSTVCFFFNLFLAFIYLSRADFWLYIQESLLVEIGGAGDQTKSAPVQGNTKLL